MSRSEHFYITTTLPYVNADPHVGFAMEIIRADVLARYHRLLGEQVFFNTGTDEHGAKIYEAAQKENLNPKEYTNRLAERFRKLKGALNLSVDNFIRTTDAHHISAAQEFWRRCEAAGDIYKKHYKIKYCVGCELEKTDSELEGGCCPIHPNRELEMREEENYFFRFSKYTQPLLGFYEENPNFVIPDFRFNETKAFVGRGLEDFSISRLKSKMPWGVPVPGDDEHVMYVWFDALVNYVSAIGWPSDMEKFKKWWPVVQYCGKDNNRQQSAMWQAMLLSAGLPNSRHIIINGFILSGGQKMSKSLGNAINPFDVIEFFKSHTAFPEDVLRFILLHDIPSFEDGDLTMESIKESYVAHLQNGIGNLTSRIMKMASGHLSNIVLSDDVLFPSDLSKEYAYAFSEFDLKKGMIAVMEKVKSLDQFIQEKEPFKLIKHDPDEGRKMILELTIQLSVVGFMLEPFLPRTAQEIKRLVRENKMPETPLFGRLQYPPLGRS